MVVARDRSEELAMASVPQIKAEDRVACHLSGERKKCDGGFPRQRLSDAAGPWLAN